MKIIVDENISYGKEAFSDFGEVFTYAGREISSEIVKDADALVVRSITNVNEELLDGSSVKFVGTATIGTDHVDLDYLKNREICFSSAKGCNSSAVKEYFLSAIVHIAREKQFVLEGKKVGIVGVGNIGSKVAALCEKLNINVIKNDPPRARAENDVSFRPLEEALSADIVTFHVPLNLNGTDKTYHLLNEKNISLLKPGSLIINSSRGPVAENSVLKTRLRDKKDITAVLDVWEGEPNPDPSLIEKCIFATPHIAGYSLEGKFNGTLMIYNALNKFIGKDFHIKLGLPPVEKNIIELNEDGSLEEILYGILSKTYPINEDSELLKKSIGMTSEDRSQYFDYLRKNYRLRRELSNYKVKLNNYNNKYADILEFLGLEILT